MDVKDYSKPLALVFAGTGTINAKNLQDNLVDFIFGPEPEPGEEEIERDVTIIIPIQYKNAPGVSALIRWGKPMGMEFSFLPGSPEKAMTDALKLLRQDYAQGHETVFMMCYDPESAEDLEVITEVKNNTWLTTYNLSVGMVDFFDGYESTDDRIRREEQQAAYAAEMKAKEEAEKPARAPRKTAAKKATTPRKRAASKPVVAEDKPLEIEPEKPVSEPHKHTYIWVDDNKGLSGSFCECGEQEPKEVLSGLDKLVDDAVKREAEKKTARESIELSGTIVMGSPKLPENLSPVETADVWSDVAKSIPATTTHISVTKEDIVELGEAMEEMANAFGKAIRVYKNIVEGQ